MTSPSDHPDRSEALTLDEVRRRLAEARGPQYWRSLDELAQSPEFRDLVEREFPRQAAEWPEGFSRRRFFELSAASLAMAGLTACTRQPAEWIVPYVRQPEDLVPGKPLFYATAFELGGYGLGLLAESHMGRPTKVEGNPEHPISRGATDLFAQASILDLYDPDRSQVVRYLDRISTWEQLFEALASKMQALGALGGEGLHILTGAVTSPTLNGQIADLAERYPNLRWHRWEAAGRGSAAGAARRAFGTPTHTRYDFSKADVVVTLDADPLGSGPASVAAARQFARRRKVAGDQPDGASMNRLYAIESSPTKTSTLADHRLALPPSEVLAFAAALAAELGTPGASAPDGGFSRPEAERWVRAIATDLAAHRGAGLVVAGDYAPAELHVLAQAINETLGNFGTTVLHTEPVEAETFDGVGSLVELVEALDAGRVDTLVLLDVNPVYDAPADLGFVDAIQKAGTRIHLGPFLNETAAYCQWHVPAAHYLESWGDTRADDGTVSLIQPLIEPLFGGKTATELLSLIAGESVASLDLVRRQWQSAGLGGDDFDSAWRRALHDGLVPETAAPAKAVTVSAAAVAAASAGAATARASAGGGGLELIFRPDPTVHDGRFANNGWLQETPKPLTTLTWDNALHLSPRGAAAAGVSTGDLVEISSGGRTLTAPVWVMPGHADGCATLHLGYGRERSGRVGIGAGVDANRLRTSDALWVRPGVTLAATGGTYPLASTQSHHAMELQSREAESRHLVRHGTLERYRDEPDFVSHIGHGAPGPEDSLFPPHEYPGNAWGLAVDLSACTGCQACVVACQSENTIPVVGKEQVLAGREMHWIRIDRYYEGDLDDPSVHHQPVMCMHCEQAPCEVVCPVAATVHNHEGLNDMVYNRCVGTRYCSNNCPYKVRRFNFFNYSKTDSELVAMARNPDVTVRFRGVMEKCSYCVQRINAVRIDARRQQREIRDGEIKTACQQACPSEAIVFGNVNDPDSEVSRWKASPLNYGLLEGLGTRPRTTYLAKLTNPNPELAPESAAGSSHEGEHHG